MEMVKQMKDIDPGRAYSIMKKLIMEVPKPTDKTQAVYANSANGDTKSFMNSVVKIRKMYKLANTTYRSLGDNPNIRDFDPSPYIATFEEVNFSKSRWFTVFLSIKEKLETKHMDLNRPWIEHAYKLITKQGRTQGWISLEQTMERAMATEDGVNRWPKAYARSILDSTIFRPEVKEKIPAFYIIKNNNILKPYFNHATDGYHGQTGKYEAGTHQSDLSQPIFGTIFNQRPLQYENPDSNTVLNKKGLIIIQVEMETAPTIDRNTGKFRDRMCMLGCDRVEKIKVQLKSIEAKNGMDTKSFENIDSLAREINEPGLQQHVLETMLKQVNGSEVTEHGYIGHSQYTVFKNQIDGNHKNHTKAHRNAKSRADQRDMDETDARFIASCNFHMEMSQCPKNALMFIKMTKYCNDNNTHIMFVSAAPMTWARLVRSWRGGFLQIRPEIMKNEALEDFRQDFGLDSPTLSATPTLMEILGQYKLYMATYRYTPGMDGTIVINNPPVPNITTAVEKKYYDSFYKQMDHAVDTMDIIVLQNDEREPILEVLVQMEGNTFPADMQAATGSMQPNWHWNRQRFTENGDPYYRTKEGELQRDQPVILSLGLPKTSTPIYAPQERIHFSNVITHTETTDDSVSEINVRIMQRRAGQQTNIWERRKELIQRHLVDQTEVNFQLGLEKAAFMNPLQTQRADGSYGAPKFSQLMPIEYKRYIAEEKSSVDYR